MQEYKFFVRSSNCDFTERQRNLFDSLNAAEKEKNERQTPAESSSTNDDHFTEEMEIQHSEERESLKRKRSQTKQFRGKESIFKKPFQLPPRFKEKDIPDHQRNPHKWVKYTLGDVSASALTNQSNTNAALSFLKELEERKQKETAEDFNNESKKIVFRPHAQSSSTIIEVSHRERNDDVKSAVFRSSKLIMPEYVVGVDKKRKKVKKLQGNIAPVEKAKKEVTLQHLHDIEEG